MKTKYQFLILIIMALLVLGILSNSAFCEENTGLDKRVKTFLDSKTGMWRDLNIVSTDGQMLYDIIVKNKYTRALDIGTSTGHSATWIAWALSKTGGKLITIEIDRRRYNQALVNFREAGISDYIDARLANAHDLVEELEVPFDFVFSDADKAWYTNYFKALAPKLNVGGCYVTHDIYPSDIKGSVGGLSEGYYNYVTSLSNFESTITSHGFLISYKRAKK